MKEQFVYGLQYRFKKVALENEIYDMNVSLDDIIKKVRIHQDLDSVTS